MTNFLEEIVQQRRRRLAVERKAAATRRQRPATTPHFFREALTKGGVNIIAEFKRASPSRGLIRANATPAQIVFLYQSAGACAISVLTEPDYFRGSLEDLRQARAVTRLPILQKDFILDELQIEEAANAGADAILLIVAALPGETLTQLRAIAEDQFGLDALVEVHTPAEMRRAADCGATLIGVNNRDLRTFTTSLEISVELASSAPPGVTLVSESGISSPGDIARLRQCGYDGFLIGELLMRSDDPVSLIQSLREGAVEAVRHD